VPPPEVLYHGTAERNLASIRQQGLHKGQRHHVHLSPNAETALKVGMRYGKPVLLTIAAGRMHAAGLMFYRTSNNVWLTDGVAAEYITFP
jgi:putative RNA 2'-phosphotransferase